MRGVEVAVAIVAHDAQGVPQVEEREEKNCEGRRV